MDYLDRRRVIHPPQSMYTYINMNILADTQTHRMHACKKKKKTKKRMRDKKKKKNTCRHENLSQTINSKWKISDTNPEMKKYHSLIKRMILYKAKETQEHTILLPKDILTTV